MSAEPGVAVDALNAAQAAQATQATQAVQAAQSRDELRGEWRGEWRAEWLGALNATAAMLPFVLTYGFIVYGALGADAAQVGLRASVIAVVIGGAVMLLFSRTRLPAASPSASATLILGNAVLTLLQDPALRSGQPAGLGLLLAATALTVVGSGLLLALLGALRAGSLVRFVPQPVLAGFMNGVAVLIVLSQLAPLLGLQPGALQRDGLQALQGWHWEAVAVALATAVLVGIFRWRWPRAPAPLLALLLAAAVLLLWQWLSPAGAAARLPQIGPVTAAWPALDTLVPLLDPASRAVLAGHAGTLVVTALLLALIGALESVLNLAAVDQQTGDHSDPNRELMALGAANVLCGLLGGLPLVVLRLRALATLAGGGRTWRAVLLGCALLLAVFTIGLPAVQRLPTAVVAGIVVMLAWTLVDHWTRRLARQWWAGDRSASLHWSLAVVALVCAVTLRWGFVAGVGVGVLVTMLIFMRTMHRSLVRSQYTAADMPSRRVRAPAQEALLAAERPRIQVLELEGALFFGNSERLVREAQQVPGGATDLVVDLRRVSAIDASGAMAISTLAPQLRRRGIRLRVAGLTARNQHRRTLMAQGVAIVGAAAASDAPEAADGSISTYPDVDRALEAAEEAALQAIAPGQAVREVPLSACELFAGLDARQQGLLQTMLQERRLAAGERLFAQGDAGHTLYVLTAGSVSVLDREREQRFVSFSPGMCFGETALLDGGGRTADAVADVDSVVHGMSAADFDTLQQQEPALCARIYRNLARHLSARLRAAAEGWRRAAG